METNTNHSPFTATDADGRSTIHAVKVAAVSGLDGVRVTFSNREVRHYFQGVCVALVRRGRPSCDIAGAIEQIRFLAASEVI